MSLPSESVPMPRPHRLLQALHLLLGFAMTAFLLLMLGCMKAKEKKEDLGPEIPVNSINETILKASADASLDKIHVNQSIDMTHTRRIENAETVINLGRRSVEVIRKEDSADTSKVTLCILELERLNNGKFLKKVSEDVLHLQYSTPSSGASKITAASLRAGALHAPQSAEALIQEIRAMADNSNAGKITFHRLKERVATRDVPAAVKQRPGCGGLNPCELKVHYVQFEMVLWGEEGKYQKISFDFGFSGKTPYLPYGRDFEQLNGALITDCRSTYVPIESRTVYVRDCYDVSDFNRVTKSPECAIPADL